MVLGTYCHIITADVVLAGLHATQEQLTWFGMLAVVAETSSKILAGLCFEELRRGLKPFENSSCTLLKPPLKPLLKPPSQHSSSKRATEMKYSHCNTNKPFILCASKRHVLPPETARPHLIQTRHHNEPYSSSEKSRPLQVGRRCRFGEAPSEGEKRLASSLYA